MSKVTDDLRRVPLFSELNQRQLGRLGRLFRERRLDAGMSVVQEGKMSGVGFFIISEGTATVAVGGKQVARLGPGDHFGELAMISEGSAQPRSPPRRPFDVLRSRSGTSAISRSRIPT